MELTEDTLYTGAEFGKIIAAKGWQLVKYLSSNDFSEPMERHYDYHYQIGLNTIDKFIIGEPCSEGGLYFTWFGSNTRWLEKHAFEIAVPDDAQVWVEPRQKFKADKLILVKEMSPEWYMKQFEKYIRLDLLPEEMRTKEICWTAIKDDCGALRYVPDHLRTKEMYEYVTRNTQNEDVLEEIPKKMWTETMYLTALRRGAYVKLPKKLLTKQFYAKAVTVDGMILKKVPKDMITVEICVAAVFDDMETARYVPDIYADKVFPLLVARKPQSIEHVPKKHITSLMAEMAVAYNGDLLGCVPRKLITKELCELAFAGHDWDREYGGTRSTHALLGYVPHALRTQELCEIAMKRHIEAFAYVPKKFRTRKMYARVMNEAPSMIKFIPKKAIKPWMCKKAVEYDGELLEHVPKRLINRELCMIALQEDEDAIRYVPAELIDVDMCQIIVNKRFTRYNFSYIPRELLTKEMCVTAVANNSSTLDKVPLDLLDEEICLAAARGNGYMIKYIPEEFRTLEVCIVAVQTNCAAWGVVPEHLKDAVREAVPKSGKGKVVAEDSDDEYWW